MTLTLIRIQDSSMLTWGLRITRYVAHSHRRKRLWQRAIQPTHLVKIDVSSRDRKKQRGQSRIVWAYGLVGVVLWIAASVALVEFSTNSSVVHPPNSSCESCGETKQPFLDPIHGSGDVSVTANQSSHEPLKVQIASFEHTNAPLPQSQENDIWYMPALDTRVQTGANSWLLLLNPSGKAISATLSLIENNFKITQPLLVSPTSRLNVWVNTLMPDHTPVAVLTASGPLLVEQAVYRQDGAGDAGPSVNTLSRKWYAPLGIISKTDQVTLSILNPSSRLASVDMQFLTPTGSALLIHLEVEADRSSSLTLDQSVLAECAETQEQAAGLIVTSSTPVAIGGWVNGEQGFRMLAVTASPAKTWYLTDARTADTRDYLVGINPQTEPVEVQIRSAGDSTMYAFSVPAESTFGLELEDYLLNVRLFLIEFPKLPPTYGGSQVVLPCSWQLADWHQNLTAKAIRRFPIYGG